MFPGYAPEHIRNMTLRNAVDFGKFILGFTGGATLTNFNNVSGGKNCLGVCLAFLGWFAWTFGLSAFDDHILNVFEVRAKKQMSRITAKAIIAFMQNMQVVWYWTIRQNPGNTMRALWRAIDRHCSIAVTTYAGLPVPAIVRSSLIDSGPKATFDRLPVVMAANVARLMTWLFCSFQALTASASAKFGSIPFTGAATVTNDISERFAFYMPSAAVVLGDYLGLLTTTALAISVRDFLGGLIRGMLAHVSSSFRLLTMPRAVVAAPWLFYWRTTGVIIAQMCQE